MAKTSINTLPNELLTSIFTYLKDNSTLVHKVGLVSKQWHESMRHPGTWSQRKVVLAEFVNPPTTEFIQFFKETQISIIALHDFRWLDVFLPHLYQQVTELFLYNRNDDKVIVNWEPQTFDKLAKLEFISDYADLLKTWLPFTPELSVFDGSVEMTQEYTRLLLNCKKISELNTYDEAGGDDIVQMFKELPLLKTISLRPKEDSVNENTWRQVLQIEGVSDRLEHVKIREYGTPVNWRKPTSHVKLNLKELEIDGRLDSHALLLVASQHSVEKLDLYILDLAADFSTFHFPKIKELRLYGAKSPKIVCDLLAACGPELEEVHIRQTQNQDNDMTFPDLHLSFPMLKEVSIDSSPVEILSLFLKHNHGAGLKSLGVCSAIAFDYESAMQSWSELFSEAKSLETIRVPASMLLHIPDIGLKSVTDLDFTESDFIGGNDFVITEQIFQKVLLCEKLNSFYADEVTSITANNWIGRILEHLPLKKSLNVPKAKYEEGELDISGVFNCELSRLDLDATAIPTPEFAGLLLQKLPGVKVLGLNGISRSHLASLMPLIAESQLDDQFRVMLDGSKSSEPFSQCHFLDKKFSWATLETTGHVALEDYLVLAICMMYSAEEYSIYLSDEVCPEKFFPEPYNKRRENSSDYEQFIGDAIRSLVPAAMKRITGLSEEKRKEIELALLQVDASGEPHELVKEMSSGYL